MAAFDLRAVARQFAGDMQEAAEIAGKQAIGARLDRVPRLGLADGV